MERHTMNDLYQMQGLPLKAKVSMTQRRIEEWLDAWGEDRVAVSFSGGKDSTVLLHIARDVLPGMKAIFFNTGLEYPSIVRFVRNFENVEFVRPSLTFVEAIRKYGYPIISKEVSKIVGEARIYIQRHKDELLKASINNRGGVQTTFTY